MAAPSLRTEAHVRVRVPATSANLGPGFDALGLALGVHDEVVARIAPGGVQVEVTGEGAADVPRDERHLVVRSMLAAFDALGVVPPGLRLSAANTVPHGRGLGSSAAAIVAGLLAARELVVGGRHALDDDALLDLAARIEGHLDNVAACLLGGLTVAYADGGRARAVRLEPSPRLRPAVLVPATTSSTEEARGMLPATVPHADAARNAGRAALLVAALTTRTDLLLAATEDRLHEAYRGPAMPATAALVERLRAAGLPAVVSGAGPTVLVLRTEDGPARALDDVAGRDWTRWDLAVDLEGARVDDGTHQTCHPLG